MEFPIIDRETANDKDFSATLSMTIRSNALQSSHTDRCVEGCLFEALYPAPLARPVWLPRKPNSEVPLRDSRLQGPTHMACRSILPFPSIRISSTYDDDKDFLTSLTMTIRNSALHSWHTDRCVEGCLFEAHLSCAFGAPLLQGALHMACNTESTAHFKTRNASIL